MVCCIFRVFLALLLYVIHYDAVYGAALIANVSSVGRLYDNGPTTQGKQFFLGTITPMNWHQSVSNCNALKMRIATIESQDEQDRLIAMIIQSKVPNDNWWIGGTDLATSGFFQWFSSGSPMVYSAWNATQPDSFTVDCQTEHCVEIRRDCSYRWNDMMCDRLQYHVCQY